MALLAAFQASSFSCSGPSDLHLLDPWTPAGSPRRPELAPPHWELTWGGSCRPAAEGSGPASRERSPVSEGRSF